MRFPPVALVGCLVLAVAAAPAEEPDPFAAAASEVAPSLLPDERGALAAHPRVPCYRIAASVDPEAHTIAGTLTVAVPNAGDAAWERVLFRLFVAAATYPGGKLEVRDVRWDGAPAETALEDDGTTLAVLAPRPLPPGGTATLAMSFTTTVPTARTPFGIIRATRDAIVAYAWFPQLCVFEGGGWRHDRITELSEPTNTVVADYAVDVAAPEGWQALTGGLELPPGSDATHHRSVAALARNDVLVVVHGWQHRDGDAGATTVRSWFPPDVAERGAAALDVARRSLSLYAEHFGSYPYAKLDVVAVPLGAGAGGMESTGLVMIDTDAYREARARQFAWLEAMAPGAKDLDELELVIAHEVAHQWWYGLVGSDSERAPWLDESLASWSGYWYVETRHGAALADMARDCESTLAYRLILAQQGDQPLAQPVERFSEMSLGGIVYGKGDLMYRALRLRLGDERFLAFLQAYQRRFRWGRADEAGWHAVLSDIAGAEIADEFRKRWVDGGKVALADLPAATALGRILDVTGTTRGLRPTAPAPAPAAAGAP